MNTKQIIDYLNKYKTEIIKKLSADDWRHFRYYCRIKESFLNNNLDIKFKNDFCYFYAMNGPAGLNDLQKNEFLKLLSSKENDLEKVLRILYETPSNNGTRKLFLSFGTKLLHTIDKDLSIYDSYIAYVLELAKQATGSFDVKIKNRIDIYNELKNNFETLLANPEINIYLKDIRKEIVKATEMSNFEWKDALVSDTKLLDSSLWALYDSFKKIKE